MALFEGGTPILVSANCVKFYLFFIFANPKTFKCLVCVVKKFEFWWPCFKGIPHFGTSKFCQISSFLYIYLPQQFRESSLKVTKFEFWRACLGGGGQPHRGTPNFCLV